METSPRIAIIGAGFAGMGMAIRLRQEGFDNFTIYEKADEVGGTWRENTYPGVACDVPSHLYSFSFAPNPNWSERFSPGGEIQNYLVECARRYDLYRSIAFSRTVKKLSHDGARWKIEFEDGRSEDADFVVSGMGGLHKPNIPDIPGHDDFDGDVFHTAQWRDDVDLRNKRVAIVGSAASAVQVIPEIVDRVSHLDVYQRTPNWVMPRDTYKYPKSIQSLFSKVPLFTRFYRGLYFSYLEWRFNAFKNETNTAKRVVRKTFHAHLQHQVEDEALREQLTPDYEIGCKRILISDNYFPALTKDNVTLITDGIDGVTNSGIRTKDGRERDVDVIILATGFKPFDVLESVDVTGRNGLKLGEVWKDGIAAHRSLMVDGFPNFFLLLGPNSALGHNSVILMIEAQVNYLIKLLKQGMNKHPSGALIEPTRAALEQFNDDTQAALQKRVWAARCGAWYVDENGRNYTLYPHSVRHFIREMKTPDLSEYLISGASNG